MPARLAVFRALSATPDLWAVRHCVMFGDAALDAIRYRGGGHSYRSCWVYAPKLYPRHVTRSKAQRFGCWCGW